MTRRWASLAFVLTLALPAAADVRLVSPLQGSQALGPTVLEIETPSGKIDRVEFHVDGTLVSVARLAPYRSVFDFGSDLLPHSVEARVYRDGFKSMETTHVTTAGPSLNDAVTVDLVEVPILLQSRQARLRPTDVRVMEDGVQQSLIELRSERGPTEFVFVIDRSLSMASEKKLQNVLAAVGSAMKYLRSDDRATVVFFNHRVAQPRSVSHHDDLPIALPSGGTSLRDAVSSLCRGAVCLGEGSRRRTAIVISDGDDRNSRAPEEEALRRIGRGNLQVNAITLDDGEGTEFLENAAQRTGGRSIRTSPSRIQESLDRLFAEINSRHTAVYQSRGSGTGWRRIEVESRRSGVRIVSSRRGYFAE